MSAADRGVHVRRTLSITLYVVASAILAVAFVPLVLVSLLFDKVRGKGLILTRGAVFFAWYLTCELAGIVASLAIWIAGGAGLSSAGGDRRRFIDRNHALQRWWSRMLGRGACRIFSVRLDVEPHGYRFGERPVLVLVRHASTADTILACLLLTVPYGIRLRYVLKRELLWDPCLDIVGNRLPNVFVTRDSSHGAREIAAVGALAKNLGPNDGVLIYPEGTRFSPAKRARAVARLRDQGQARAARQADGLHFVLPPRAGGVLALLDAAPEADVVFLAHTGFEASASFDRFFNGGLIGRTVHVQFDVVPAERIPHGREARTDWLMQRWRAVDEFIESHQTHRLGRPGRREDQPVRLRIVR